MNALFLDPANSWNIPVDPFFQRNFPLTWGNVGGYMASPGISPDGKPTSFVKGVVNQSTKMPMQGDPYGLDVYSGVEKRPTFDAMDNNYLFRVYRTEKSANRKSPPPPSGRGLFSLDSPYHSI